MLNQQAFEATHCKDWENLESILSGLESMRPWHRRKVASQELPTLYAALCQHHAIAVGRGYSHNLTHRLHALIHRGHQQLYRYRGNWLQNSYRFLAGGFPIAIRREWRVVSLSALLFFGPFFIFMALCSWNTDMTDLILGSSERRAMESMYDPSATSIRPEGHKDSSSFLMFGYYVYNNVSIGFRMYAGGIFFGIGSVFFAVYNGIVIGAVSGHLTGIGYGVTFWSFVPGHSAPELLGLVISGAAGLMLGRALISPGQRSRLIALKEEAQASIPLVIGAALMIAFAAIIEGYWSPRDLSLEIKVIVGLVVWAVFLAYFIFAGRRREAIERLSVSAAK